MTSLACGHELAPEYLVPGRTGGTGYAVLPDESKICYACADAHEREYVRTHDRWIGYVKLAPGNGWQQCERAPGRVFQTTAGMGPGNVRPAPGELTTWSGGKVMTITRVDTKRSNWWHVGTLVQVWARDNDGRYWYGVGSGDGMAIKMRKLKEKAS